MSVTDKTTELGQKEIQELSSVLNNSKKSYLQDFSHEKTSELIIQFINKQYKKDKREEIFKESLGLILETSETPDQGDPFSEESSGSLFPQKFIIGNLVEGLEEISKTLKTRHDLVQDYFLKDFYEAVLKRPDLYTGNLIFDYMRLLSSQEYSDFTLYFTAYVLRKVSARNLIDENSEIIPVWLLYQVYTAIANASSILTGDLIQPRASTKKSRLEAIAYIAYAFGYLMSVKGLSVDDNSLKTLISRRFRNNTEEVFIEEDYYWGFKKTETTKDIEKYYREKGYREVSNHFTVFDKRDPMLLTLSEVLYFDFLEENYRELLLDTAYAYVVNFRDAGILRDSYYLLLEPKEFYYIFAQVLKAQEDGDYYSPDLLAGTIPKPL